MKLRFITNALLGLILLVSLSSGCPPDYNAPSTIHRPPIEIGKPGELPDWIKTDPMAFLDILKDHPEGQITIPSLDRPPRDWIKEEHVGQLMLMIDSQEPAAIMIDASRSNMAEKSDVTTVGKHAMLLIKGFRNKGYYPTGDSYSHIDPDELRKWWAEYQKKNPKISNPKKN